MKRSLAGVWRASLACFAVAAVTGALFRFQLAYGVQSGLALEHVRHAHSHLMYFGFASPALMALIAARMPMPRWITRVLAGMLIAALLSWPLFLLFGYEPQQIGSASLPPALVLAGVQAALWYAFALAYVRARRGLPKTRAIRLWDLAVAFMVLATLGAWGISLRGPLGIEEPWIARALIHVFLDLFSEGWFVLALLGLYWAEVAPGERGRHFSTPLIALGLPFTFALAMPADGVPPLLRGLASVGGTVAAIGLLWQIALLWPRARGWALRLPLAMLAAKSVAHLGVSLLPMVPWTELFGMRILYLHVLLLGFVTLGLLAVAERVFGGAAAPGRRLISVAVLAVLATLVPLSPLGDGAHLLSFLRIAAWIALVPPVVILAALSRAPAAVSWHREGGHHGTDTQEDVRRAQGDPGRAREDGGRDPAEAPPGRNGRAQRMDEDRAEAPRLRAASGADDRSDWGGAA